MLRQVLDKIMEWGYLIENPLAKVNWLKDLSQTFINYLIMEGVDLPTVYEHMVHVNNTIMTINAHFTPDHMK